MIQENNSADDHDRTSKDQANIQQLQPNQQQIKIVPKMKNQKKLNQEINKTCQIIQLIDDERKKQVPLLDIRFSPIFIRRQMQRNQTNLAAQNSQGYKRYQEQIEDINRSVSMNSFIGVKQTKQFKRQSKYVVEVSKSKTLEQLNLKNEIRKKQQELRTKQFKKYRLSRILSNEIFIVFVIILGAIIYQKIHTYLYS